MTEITAKKLLEVMRRDDAKERLSKAHSVEDAVCILREYGVETTALELEELSKMGMDEELTEESLDQIAGGAGWFRRAWDHIWTALNGLLDGFNGN